MTLGRLGNLKATTPPPHSAAASLTDLKNIGPKSAKWMIEAGIDSPARLAELGAVESFLRVKARHPRGVSLNMLWALHGALTNTAYNRLDPEEREMLKAAMNEAERSQQ